MLGREGVTETVLTQEVLIWHIYIQESDGEMSVQERTMLVSKGTSGFVFQHVWNLIQCPGLL